MLAPSAPPTPPAPPIVPARRAAPSLLALVLAAASPAGLPAPPERPLPSIVAEHVAWHAPSGNELLRARVELAPEGLRVSRDGADGALEIVEDFVGGRAWLIDGRRRVAYALALTDASPGTVTSARTGLLDTRPCARGAARALGGGRWRGREVQLHSCLGPDGESLAIERVDREHGIVVRRDAADGRVDELRGLRARRFAPGHFVPHASLRAVDDVEFFVGTPELGRYDEGRTRGAPVALGSRP